MTPSELFAFVEDFLNFKLFTVQNTPITLSSLFVLGILLFLVSLASRLMRDVVVKRLVNKFQIDEGTRYTLARLSQYTMLVLGSVFSFQFVGIDLSGFTVIFGLLSVGIGFGLQNITSNFISGLIVLFERPITVGDRVIINDLEGDVREINIRSTRIQTLNNVSVIVPNSQFVEGTVINMSHGESKLRIIVDVGVSYDSDLDTVMKALKEVAEEHPKVLKHPEPLVLFLNFGDSS